MTFRTLLMGATGALTGLGAAWGALAADYTVLTTGRPSGAMVVAVDGATRSVTYSYNDRGRGPDVKSVVTVGADGTPSAQTVTGVDYLKAPGGRTLHAHRRACRLVKPGRRRTV